MTRSRTERPRWLVIDIELVASTGKHIFFDTLHGDESKNPDNLGVSNTMGTILRLKIGMRIPECSPSITVMVGELNSPVTVEAGVYANKGQRIDTTSRKRELT